MEFRKGINGQTILNKNQLERTKELYKNLGEFLAIRIHSKKYHFTSSQIRACNLTEINLHLHFVPNVLIVESKKILKNINDTKEQWILTDGDY